jgi:hypothetical protein
LNGGLREFHDACGFADTDGNDQDADGLAINVESYGHGGGVE